MTSRQPRVLSFEDFMAEHHTSWRNRLLLAYDTLVKIGSIVPPLDKPCVQHDYQWIQGLGLHCCTRCGEER